MKIKRELYLSVKINEYAPPEKYSINDCVEIKTTCGKTIKGLIDNIFGDQMVVDSYLTAGEMFFIKYDEVEEIKGCSYEKKKDSIKLLENGLVELEEE